MALYRKLAKDATIRFARKHERLDLMGEFDHIAWIRQRTPQTGRILVGPGDDRAVIASSQGEDGRIAGEVGRIGNPSYLMQYGRIGNPSYLVTTDMLLEGSHFILAEAGPRRVGRKAMAVNLSDIAAMGGTPVAAVVSVGCRAIKPGRLPRKSISVYGTPPTPSASPSPAAIPNTWNGPLALSVTLFGDPGPQGPILRSGAKPGDWLFVTGPLGGSILGKHLDFTPRIREALDLQMHASIHAMIDISDGLSADVFHLCEESHCGAVLFAEQIPISAAAVQINDAKSPLEHALSDGEDFELAFAVSPSDGERLQMMNRSEA